MVSYRRLLQDVEAVVLGTSDQPSSPSEQGTFLGVLDLFKDAFRYQSSSVIIQGRAMWVNEHGWRTEPIRFWPQRRLHLAEFQRLSFFGRENKLMDSVLKSLSSEYAHWEVSLVNKNKSEIVRYRL